MALWLYVQSADQQKQHQYYTDILRMRLLTQQSGEKFFSEAVR